MYRLGTGDTDRRSEPTPSSLTVVCDQVSAAWYHNLALAQHKVYTLGTTQGSIVAHQPELVQALAEVF